jgi:hypothetical protein
MPFKKITFILIPVALLAFSELTFAQYVNARLRNISSSLETKSGFAIGGQLFDYKYEEPTVMNTKGTKMGVFVDLTSRTGNSWYWTLGGRYARGDVTYTGSGTKKDNPDSLWELRFIWGRDLKVWKHALSPYAGVGYRTLYNDLRGVSSTGAVGYRRDSQYFYVPLGLTYRIPLGPIYRLSFNGEYDYFIEGRQKSYLMTDTGLWFDDPVNKQRKGHGTKFNIWFEKSNWAYGAFVNHWDIGQSQINYYLGGASYVYEPANNTKEVGFQFKYQF